MEKMKQNFSKKQALFADKNKDQLIEANTESSPETLSASKDKISCQYCLEPINTDTAPYGVPLFVAYTNNFYDSNSKPPSFTQTSYTNLTQAQWWPVITSCHHYYHQSCYETHTLNMRRPQEPINVLFKEDSESQCSLCKTLCNNFLLEKTQVNTITEIPDLLLLNLQDLLKTRLEKIKDIANVPSNLNRDPEIVPYSEIFERAYSYLVESFHIYSTSTATLQLYINFFRGFQYYFYHNERPQVQSFLDMKRKNPDDAIDIILDKLFAALLIEKLSTAPHSNSEQETKKAHLQLIREYLSLIQNKSPQDLIFPLQKAAFAFYINLSTLNINLEPSFLDLILYPEQTQDYLVKLLQVFDPTISSIDQITTNKTSNPTTCIKMLPRMIQLPETYAEFNKKYMAARCSLCKGYSENLTRCICLICGDFMCGLYCNSPNPVLGNLNRHAKKCHMGIGLFIDVHSLAYQVVSAGTNALAMKHEIYIDQLGQPIRKFLKDNAEVKTLDFKQFKLNPEALNQFQEIIHAHNMRKEVFRTAYNDNQVVNDNAL